MSAPHRSAVDAARRYAQVERTDPFAFARALTHIEIGIASLSRPESTRDSGYSVPAGTRCLYDAEPYREARQFTRANGEIVKYDVPAFRNMVRP